MMENGVANGLPTNHDRQHGAADGAVATSSATAVNGHMQHEPPPPPRMNDLPDEIQHITQGYIPLGVLLSRLAQSTHNDLQSKILAWARMSVPSASMLNGHPHDGNTPDDDSPENLRKKADILQFIQDAHAKWVKALVITSWSRKAEPVSKLIDLMNHINMQRRVYDDSLDYLINIKRDLTFARLPNPDLHTALHVLSSGDAPWMPDLGYIEPPPLSLKEQLLWIDNLNTLLSLRLNLEDHDKIPFHFRDYTIESGRVTFKVPGEFEVDLTIADEDFEKQFWFIDFRFAFTPAPDDLSDALRMFLEQRVNEALEKDGLIGCYKFLHEFVLTHKLTEYVRQAMDMSRGQWVGTLKVERLHRSMSIQYWVGRYPSAGPKSWVIMGVDSGRKAGKPLDPKGTSKLSLRWFRDSKEIKDVDIPLDEADISAERLLKKVIGQHIGHILTTIHARLSDKDRFVKRQAALALQISKDDPVQSALKMQLGASEYITVRIAPTTGLFAITPQTDVTARGELFLNKVAKDPAEEGLLCLENIRCTYTMSEMSRSGKSMGWEPCKKPVSSDDIKRILQTRESYQASWYKRCGLPDQWYIMLSLSLSGDRWYLVEISTDNQPRVVSWTQLPLSSGLIRPSDKFFTDLTIFTSGMIEHISDLKELHARRVKYSTRDDSRSTLPPNMKIPTIFLRLSDVLAQNKAPDADKTVSWAADFLQVTFKGVKDSVVRTPRNGGINENPNNDNDSEGVAVANKRLINFVDARFKVAHAARLSNLDGIVERDVAFNKQLGVFALRIETEVGRPILATLAHRVGAIERLVECIDAIRQSNRDITCEEIALNKVAFSYSGQSKGSADANAVRWKAKFDLNTDNIKLRLEKGNPQLRVLDMYQHLINSQLRFARVPFFLSNTAHLHRVLDAIEASWEDFTLKNQGRVEIFAAHLDWFFIRYFMIGGPRKEERRVTLQIKLREHRGGCVWHVFRGEPGLVERPDDVFKKALQSVWSRNGMPWENLTNSAACRTDEAIELLLKAADEAVRSSANKSSPVMTKKEAAKPQGQPAGNKMQGHAKNQTPRMSQQQINAQRAQAQVHQANSAGVVVLDD